MSAAKARFLPVCFLILLSSCVEQPPAFTYANGLKFSTFAIQRHAYLLPEGEKVVQIASASLYQPDSGLWADGGIVTINGYPLPQYSAMQDRVGYLRNDSGNTIPLKFDGSYEVFQVSGGAGFPPFADSIEGMKGRMDLIYPRPDDVVPRTGFTIRWSAHPGSRDSVGIGIISGRCTTAVGRVPDIGSCDVPASRFGCAEPGAIQIVLTRSRTVKDSIYPGNPYQMSILDQVDVYTVLQ